jgi:hypothetical protein
MLHKKRFISFALLVASIVGLGAALFVEPAYSQDFQNVPIILKASEAIPKDWLKGSNYTIKETITNDGISSTYELDTTYGPVVVESTVLLLKRIHELLALHKMDQLQGTDIFKKAAQGAATGPLTTTKGLVKDPVGTVSAVGSGIGGFFSRVGASVTSDDPNQPDAMKSALGQAANKREFAYQFNVDPYSPYPPLQKTLDSIAWTATGGSLTVKAAFSAIPGGAGAIVSMTGTADSLRSLVRDKTPAELQKINAKMLLDMGISGSLAKVFLNNYAYDPQEKTLLIGELANMKSVQDKAVFIVAACAAQQESMAVYMRVMAQLMTIYNEKTKSVERFVEADGLPFIQKKDGTVVGIFPVDRLFWTQKFAQKEKEVSEALRKMPRVKKKELWLAGTVDQRARKALEERGWKIEERFGETLLREIVGKTIAQKGSKQ